MQTKPLEQIFEQADIFGMARRNGISPESIVAYGVYGSQAVGLATKTATSTFSLLLMKTSKRTAA